MTVYGVPVALTPLGLLVIPLGLSWAGGRHLARSQPPPDVGAAARVVGLFALGYTLVTTAVVVAAAGDVARADAGEHAAVGRRSVVAGRSDRCDARRATRRRQVRSCVPTGCGPVLAAGTAAALVVVAAAAVIAAVCLAAALPESAAISQRLHAGVLGWRPGRAARHGLRAQPGGLGRRRSRRVRASRWVRPPRCLPGWSSTGRLPAFPPVAALPPEGVVPPVGWLVLLLPVAAGVLAGLVVARRVDAATHQVAGSAAASGLVAGFWLGDPGLAVGRRIGRAAAHRDRTGRRSGGTGGRPRGGPGGRGHRLGGSPAWLGNPWSPVPGRTRCRSPASSTSPPTGAGRRGSAPFRMAQRLAASLGPSSARPGWLGSSCVRGSIRVAAGGSPCDAPTTTEGLT